MHDGFNISLPLPPDCVIDCSKRDVFRYLFMKQREGKDKKQRLSTKASSAKTVCGTLSYLAEGRGTLQKDASMRWAAPPAEHNRLIRT
jgi:hypothetical protein